MVLPKVAKIAVEQAAFHFDRLYDYYVPDSIGKVQRGCRVIVPFGGGNRKRQGIVVEYDTAPDVEKLKPVYSVIDKNPLVSDELMDLAIWLKQRTFCSLFDAVRAMLPTGLNMRVKPVYKAVSESEITGSMTVEQRAVYSCVAAYKNGIDRERLLSKMGLDTDTDLPERLVRMGALVRSDDAFRRIGDATVRMVRPAVDPDTLAQAVEGKLCTAKQKSVLKLLLDVGCASVREIGYFCSVTDAVVRALEKKGLVECFDSEVLRTPFANNVTNPKIVSVELSDEQQCAFNKLLALYKSGSPTASLLYGVTGSGKTQVYMNLIDCVIADGRQVIVLVPEISLTPQMLELFIKKYGNRVAVLHSGLAIGERTDEWKRIRRGDAQIIVGTRSAVFAPAQNIGLIIMDEEQEHTYKSESSPRYHARDVARFRCARHNALLLLASATPSVETYHAAITGRYHFQILSERFGKAQLPKVEVVDMRGQTEAVAGGIVSVRLKDEIDMTLSQGQQVILLLNRRGYHTFVSCRSCGNVITCPSCSISLNYHRANGRLMCHYCGHSQQPISQCPECESTKIRYSGLGTQRAQYELEQIFPNASILRMDTDVTMSRLAYEENFSKFANGEYDIMIGTQMVAKGLDFPNVGLVGVLLADQSLYADDFRSFESTFALLTQVVGRAGRRDTAGKALIQTFTPENHVIELAALQDYHAFFEIEIAARKMMKYPPYSDLCMFGFTGIDEQEVKRAAFRFLALLRKSATQKYTELPVIVLDPTPASVSRVAGKYRYKLLMKTRNNTAMREMISELIIQFARSSENKSVTVFVDINPCGIM